MRVQPATRKPALQGQRSRCGSKNGVTHLPKTVVQGLLHQNMAPGEQILHKGSTLPCNLCLLVLRRVLDMQ